MLYARIDLSKTNYELYSDFRILNVDPPIKRLQELYTRYCRYKKFKSVMPIFREEFTDPNTDIIGYYHNNKLAAFSLVKRYQHDSSVDAVQFAWDYVNPELRLGIESLKSECAWYKSQGFRYLYLGEAHEYKKEIDGFELLGPV